MENKPNSEKTQEVQRYVTQNFVILVFFRCSAYFPFTYIKLKVKLKHFAFPKSNEGNEIDCAFYSRVDKIVEQTKTIIPVNTEGNTLINTNSTAPGGIREIR